MKKIIVIASIIVGVFFINALTSTWSEIREDAVELNDKKWIDIDNTQIKLSSSFYYFHLSWNKFVTHSIFIDRRIKAPNKDRSIQIADLYEDGVNNYVHEIPSNNILNLTDAISYDEKSVGIYTHPNEDGYYNQTVHLEFSESLPMVIKRIFSDHYLYFQTDSGKLLAHKLDVLPINSMRFILFLVLFIFALFFYLAINGINFLWGLVLGTLYSCLLVILDFTSVLFPIIFVSILLISIYAGFKIKIWDINRKVFTKPVIIVGIILCLSAILYFYFYDVRVGTFINQNKIYNVLAMLFLAIFIFGYFVYDLTRLYRILALRLWGHKVHIKEIEISSAFIKVYRRSLPDYLMTLKINNEFYYNDLNCTRKIYSEYKAINKVYNCTTLYYNKKGDVLIL